MKVATSDPQEVMTKARLHLMFNSKWMFFASLVFHLNPVLVTDDKEAKRIWRGQPPTMATDGRNLYYHAEFLKKLDPANAFQQLMGVLAHEGLHYGLGHMFRIGERDPVLWNIACDISINYHVKAAGMQLPADCIDINSKKVQDMFKPLPAGMTFQKVAEEWDAEQIFQHFDNKKCGGSKQAMPQWGIILKPQSADGSGEDAEGEELKEMAHGARDAFVQAAANAKLQGNMPGTLEGHITEMTKPQVDWRRVLHNFMASAVPFDYTWKRPSRRFIGRGMYLPNNNKRNFGTICLFIDTSGSVSDQELSHFLGEINNLTNLYQFEEVIIVPCDYAVQTQGIVRYKRGEVVKTLRCDGRGGTSFRPPFDWLKQNPDIKPIRIVYFTDMEGDFPPPCDVPTLWVATTKHKAPWGETVQIEVGR